MAEYEQEKQQVQRAPTATAPTAATSEGAMHETRMNVTRHRRAAMRKSEGKAGAGPQVDIPEGGGQKLPGSVQKTMEKKLGADLSGVKVHTGGDSAGASEKLNARAFTVGSDVHFNAGQFDPGSKEGTKLLAHELTHVVQGQKGGIQKKEEESEEADAEGKDGEALEVSDPEEPAEQEADAVADEATADMGDKGAEGEGGEAEAEEASNDVAGPEGKKGDEEEEAAAETEQAAPEAGAKLQSKISAKYQASALRKILRKKVSRDEEEKEAPEAEAAPAEAAAAEGGEGDAKADAAPAEAASAEAAAPEAAAAPPEGEGEAKEEKKVAAKLKGIHRKIFRAPAADPAKQAQIDKAKACTTPAQVDDFCKADPIATQKLADVKAENNLEGGKSGAARDGFYTKVASYIKSNADTINPATIFNSCFNNIATEWKFMGTKVDVSKIGGAMSRTCGLGGFWWTAVDQKKYMDMFAGQPDQANLAQAKWKEDAKDPGKLMASLDRGKTIKPDKGTWFTPDSYKLKDAKDAGFSDLLELAALQPEWFGEGNIAFEIDVTTAGAFEAKKPTAYDGMQSALWVSRPGPDSFGVTGGGANEFMAKDVAVAGIKSAQAVIPGADTLAQLQEAVTKARDMALAADPALKAALDAAPAGSPAKKQLEGMIPNLTDMFLRGTPGLTLSAAVKDMLTKIKTATETERANPSAARGPGSPTPPSRR